MSILSGSPFLHALYVLRISHLAYQIETGAIQHCVLESTRHLGDLSGAVFESFIQMCISTRHILCAESIAYLFSDSSKELMYVGRMLVVVHTISRRGKKEGIKKDI